MLPDRETANGVEIIRYGTLRFSRDSYLARFLGYTALYPQFFWQVLRLGAVDAVVSMTDPPLQVAVVTPAAFRARKKIHWAQDVYPELAEELGVIPREGVVALLLRAVSSWALRKQDEIVAVGRCMRKRLVARGLNAGKIEVIPNWSRTGAARGEDIAAKRKELGWDGQFVALYSGNLGLAHDFITLAGAARELEGIGVRMVFAGEGPRLDEVKRALAGLSHVSFLPPQAKDTLGAFLGAADAHLVSVRAGLEGLVVPSKAYAAFSVRRPLVYVGGNNAEIPAAVRESGCGAVVANGDSEELAALLRQMAEGASAREKPNERMTAAEEEFAFAKAADHWKEILRA